MAHGDAREGKWRGTLRMEWVASSLALDDGARSIQLLSADPRFSAASSRLNWHPRRFKWTRPFRWKTKSGFRACAITFRTCYTYVTPWRVRRPNLIYERAPCNIAQERCLQLKSCYEEFVHVRSTEFIVIYTSDMLTKDPNLAVLIPVIYHFFTFVLVCLLRPPFPTLIPARYQLTKDAEMLT